MGPASNVQRYIHVQRYILNKFEKMNSCICNFYGIQKLELACGFLVLILRSVGIAVESEVIQKQLKVVEIMDGKMTGKIRSACREKTFLRGKAQLRHSCRDN